ncbi:LOW QUALITY PROTEIN: hypothetical protein CVT25_010172 [Psilocybe cyanescens]|uniref:Uncharacterized protein n=1 Tax=Psilocybe cyanescens TaxID=93625 RepID=A0A409XIY5_PSICY|nr:LOW QUALITY PROTEIN: hypothetical protein CVT25_010172 [Psilocybe cyanescens]
MSVKISIQDEAHTHIKLAQEWDQVLTRVRTIPQFKDFLHPLSYSTLFRNLPDSGHVVVINIHEDHSDSLILTSSAEGPLHIALPDFSSRIADDLYHDLKILLHNSKIQSQGDRNNTGCRSHLHKRASVADILHQLWSFVVKPILNSLEYSCFDNSFTLFLRLTLLLKQPASNLPHIWWCATGPLTFLPIHAAGIYTSTASPGVYNKLSDFAVSSYIPIISFLVKIKQNAEQINIKKLDC